MQAASIKGHCRGRSNLAENVDIDVFIQVCINSNLLYQVKAKIEKVDTQQYLQ